MKNVIKIIAALGVATSFSLLYSMEVSQRPLTYNLKLDDLKSINLFSDTDSTEKGLSLKLATVKYFTEPDSTKKDKTLEEITTVVSLGAPIGSEYCFNNVNEGFLTITLDRETPISVFDDMGMWIEYTGTGLEAAENEEKKLMQKEFAILRGRMFRLKKDIVEIDNIEDKETNQLSLSILEKRQEKSGKYFTVILDKQMNNKIVRQLFDAIFRGEDKRIERLACIKDRLSTEYYLPKTLVLLMCSFLPEDDDEERIAIIKQARQEFDERQQRQLRVCSNLVA